MYKTDIANLALGYCAVSLTVSDIDTDNSTQAKIIRRNFQTSLETYLEVHPWGFATQYQAMALIEENPSSGYDYSYARPADALTIRQVAKEDCFVNDFEQYEQHKIPFKEMYSGSGVRIHTDLKDAHCEYTTKIQDTYDFPSHFARGLAAQIAMDIAPQLITNNYAKIKQTLLSDLDRIMTKGISDDLGKQPRKKDPISPFQAARYRG